MAESKIQHNGWKEIFNGHLPLNTTKDLSESVLNFSELLVEYYIGNYMQTDIVRSGMAHLQCVIGNILYVDATYKGRTTIQFFSDTQIKMIELSTTGWTARDTVRIYGR